MKKEDILSNLFNELFSEWHSSQEPFEERKAEIIAKYSKLLSCQPVISEEEIKDFAENDYGSPEVEQTSDLESILYKGYMSGYNDGFKKGLSLSSNDKQEKKPTETGEVIASYDEVKYTEELIKKLNYNTVYTCDTRKSERGSVSTFKKDILYTPAGWIGLDDGYIVTSVLIPVYYPEKKGESND